MNRDSFYQGDSYNNYNYEQRRGFNIQPPKKKLKIGRWILLGFIIYYIFTSISEKELFEDQKPVIDFPEKQFWNLDDVVRVKISDNREIESYKITLQGSDEKVFTLEENSFEEPTESSFEFNLSIPRVGVNFRNNIAKVTVEAKDSSLWNWFEGNSVKHEYRLLIDEKRPQISLISTSYGIRRGGTALIIFKVVEENLKNVVIKSRTGKEFIPQPFLSKGKGYYASLVAWHVNDPTFSASIYAEDRAGNKQSRSLNIYLKEKKYRRSQINLNDKFLSGKITELAQKHEKSSFTDNPLDFFRIVNEDIRKQNEDLIHKLTSVVDKSKIVSEFDMNPFKPLKGSVPVASFGDHRKYFYEGEFVSESYHLGLDMASTKMAPVYSSNSGEIVFNDYNGVYGLSPIVSHGFGLYTIYSHCSTAPFKVGEYVDDYSVVGKSGTTGLAFGDHLHFGIYVQGVEVRPEEWMDKKWMKTNITDVIASAKKIIERQ
jgi:murein DD-endopeptidase MepM/ murein hydrolase activator NlpD